ncbi:MAG: hypothetical protein ABIH71_05865 [Candidatus Omnitrophota bacterium]|nr:hypothetical protein [Candidatus Omnitrophota bacterium]
MLRICQILFFTAVCGIAFSSISSAEDFSPEDISSVSQAIAEMDLMRGEHEEKVVNNSWFTTVEGERVERYRALGLLSSNKDSPVRVIESYFSTIQLGSFPGGEIIPTANYIYTMWKNNSPKTSQEFYEATRSFDLILGGPIRCYGDAVKLMDSDIFSWPAMLSKQTKDYGKGSFLSQGKWSKWFTNQIYKGQVDNHLSGTVFLGEKWGGWVSNQIYKGKITSQEFQSLYGYKKTRNIFVKHLPANGYNSKNIGQVYDMKAYELYNLKKNEVFSQTKWQGDLGSTFQTACENFNHKRGLTSHNYLVDKNWVIPKSKINFFQKNYGYPSIPMQGNFPKANWNGSKLIPYNKRMN